MISLLRGVHAGMDTNGAITVDVAGVGYLVTFSDRDRRIVNERGDGGEIRAYVRTVVSETSIRLFGFLSMADRVAFDSLCTVEGVGPGTAIKILSVIDAGRLNEVRNHTSPVPKVPGVGPKTWDKIVEGA